MQKTLLLLVVSFFVGRNCQAQNLVPNPSFEIHSDCPDNLDQVYKATGWNSFYSSPDYFSSCSSTHVNVPMNDFGFEFAAEGNSYCGFYSFYSFLQLINYREYLGRELATTLISGNKYYVSIKISLANVGNCATNNIGVLFSTVQPSDSSINCFLHDHAQVNSSFIINDTSNWNIISGSFIADSSYKYIVIGNFFHDALTDTIVYDGNHCSAYYYIDDVCVSPDSLACDLNPEGIYNLKETKASINLYPNPATEQLIIDNGQLIIKEIEISDALGRIQRCEFKVQRPSTQIDIHSLPSGIYFIKVYFADGSMEVRRFVKE